MKTLHLTLRKQWYDLILSGEKKEEYREIKPYWKKRFCAPLCDNMKDLDKICHEGDTRTMFDLIKNDLDKIIFTNGYSKNSPRMTVECKGIEIGIGKKEWGAPDEKVFIIKLGNIHEQSSK